MQALKLAQQGMVKETDTKVDFSDFCDDQGMEVDNDGGDDDEMDAEDEGTDGCNLSSKKKF